MEGHDRLEVKYSEKFLALMLSVPLFCIVTLLILPLRVNLAP